MTKQIGLEAEYFVAKLDDTIIPAIIPLNYPVDESGILLEIRGKHGDPYEAVGSFVAEYFRVVDKLYENKFTILYETRIRLPNYLKLELSRGFSKPIYKAQNLYNDNRTHVKNSSYHHAGLHVHFSSNTVYKSHTADGQYSKDIIIPQLLDIPKIVRKMDEQYQNVIRDKYRNLGCYELKGDNFEYRSLPTKWILTFSDIRYLISLAEFAYSLF